jgi:ligand-binding SRPBCC domain-containing protein
MKYHSRFRVLAPQDFVADFHRRSESMTAITPPLIPVQMEDVPRILDSGDQMTFKMWLGFAPLKWRAYIGQVSPNGFTDHQLEGPFRYWIHRHEFVPVDELTTEVVDTVHAGLRWHPFWGLVGLAMWLGMPLLFAFRGWKTQRLLDRRPTE